MQDLLTPNKCNVCLVSQSFADQCHKESDWFKALYIDEGIITSLYIILRHRFTYLYDRH